MIEVVNLVQNPVETLLEGDILCDRSTKWGNPFIMYYQSQRDEVCDNFEKYFLIMEQTNGVGGEALVSKLMSDLGLSEFEAKRCVEKTGGHLDISEIAHARRLLCHCAPRRCHCDYLKKRIEAFNNGAQSKLEVQETIEDDVWGGGK